MPRNEHDFMQFLQHSSSRPTRIVLVSGSPIHTVEMSYPQEHPVSLGKPEPAISFLQRLDNGSIHRLRKIRIRPI
jgi:hypothetical protein